VQNREEMNLSVVQGVAVREFKLKQGHGYADYLLFVDGKAIGVLEAKAPGHTLIGVEPQSTKYANGLPDGLNPPIYRTAPPGRPRNRSPFSMAGVFEPPTSTGATCTRKASPTRTQRSRGSG
jgi:hypothetical protein